MSINMYAAACSENGGIYHYTLNENGSLNFKEKINIDRPMYMCIENGKMYVVLRKPFENDNSGIFVCQPKNRCPVMILNHQFYSLYRLDHPI